MAAHRYWRIRNHAHLSSQTGVGELEMATSPGGVDVCTGGTPFASGSLGGTYVPASAFDNNPNTNWFTSGGNTYNGAWLAYDFGAGNERDIVEVRMVRAVEDSNGTPRIFYVEWSDDNLTWNWAWTCYNTSGFGSATAIIFTKPATQFSNRWWGIFQIQNQLGSRDLVLSEMQMRAVIGGADQTGSGTPSYFPADPGFPAANAFDNNTATLIYAGVSNRGVMVRYDFGAGNDIEIAEIAITSSDSASNNNTRCITDGWVLYSQDGLSWNRFGQIVTGSWGSIVTKTFITDLPAPGGANRRRMIIVT